MSTLTWVPRITAEVKVQVTPTVSTSPAYSAGDQVGGVMTLADVLRQETTLGYGTAMLTSIKVFCKSNNTPALEVLFFQNSPTVASSDNASFNITSANALSAGFIARASIGSAYTTSGGTAGAGVNAFSTDSNLNIPVWTPGTSSTPTTIYAVMKTSGTPTFTSTTDLVLEFTFLVD